MKKGFTLIELLAVIVILAIIALIVTPVISDIIASARNAANQRSVEGHIKNIEYAIVQKGFENGDGDLSKYDDIVTDSAIRSTLTIPTSDPITCESYKIKNGIVLEAKGCINNSENWGKTHDYESDKESSSGPTVPDVAGAVETNAHGGTVYKGRILSTPITVFYNVSTGTKCSESDWTTNGGSSNNGMKTGCLRFYAYMEDNLSYTMILDRNTDNTRSIWATSTNNQSGPVNALPNLKNDTDSWVGTIIPSNYTYVYTTNGTDNATYTINYDNDNYKARFITVDELARIVGKTNFDSYNSYSDWFYFDGSDATTWQTQTLNASNESNYKWLYNYVKDCIYCGCDTDGVNRYGYWTSDAISNDVHRAWFVSFEGRMNSSVLDSWVSDDNNYGIRPVITVLKSALN